MKSNITLKELRKCVEFAEVYGSTEHKTVTIELTSNGIGGCTIVSTTPFSEVQKSEDVTDSESW